MSNDPDATQPTPQEPEATPAPSEQPESTGRRRTLLLAGILAIAAVVTFGVTALLVTIFEHQVEARRAVDTVHALTARARAT